MQYKVEYKGWKTVRCFSRSDVNGRNEANELFTWGILRLQPLENFSNLNFLNTWILPFWRFKKANFKSWDSEN